MATSDYDIDELWIDTSNNSMSINSTTPYSDTYIHSNEVCVISEDGKEVKLLDELHRVSTELAVMRGLLSTLLEKVELDPNVELDFDKRVEHYRMFNKLAGEQHGNF